MGPMPDAGVLAAAAQKAGLSPSMMQMILGAQQAPPPLPPPAQSGNGQVTVTAPLGRGGPVGPPLTPAGRQPVQAAPTVQNVQPFDAPTLTPQNADQSAQPTSIDYNNTNDVMAARAANAQTDPYKIGPSSNPGLYGILPAGLQHGTFRNVLGAISDAFLVGGHEAPAYANEMAREKEGNAMAGIDWNDPNSVNAGLSRLEATGAPGAMAAAQTARQADMENQVRLGQLQITNQFHQDMNANRKDSIAATMRQGAGQTLNNSANTAAYAQNYKLLQQTVSRLYPDDPNATPASVWGFETPDQWHPGDFQGETAGQAVRANTAAAGQANSAAIAHGHDVQSGQNAQTNAQARVSAAQIIAQKASDPNERARLAQIVNSGRPLSPGDQKVWDYLTTHSTGRRSGSGLAPGVTVGGAAAPAGGRAPPPTGPAQSDIAYLRAHPNMAARFDKQFGPGSAESLLKH